MVGLARVELATSSLSGMRSNQLSYKPTYHSSKKSLLAHPSEERLAVHRNLEMRDNRASNSKKRIPVRNQTCLEIFITPKNGAKSK